MSNATLQQDGSIEHSVLRYGVRPRPQRLFDWSSFAGTSATWHSPFRFHEEFARRGPRDPRIAAEPVRFACFPGPYCTRLRPHPRL